MMAEFGGGLTLVYCGLYFIILVLHHKSMEKGKVFNKMLQYLINAQVVLMKYPDFKKEKTTINAEVFPFVENIARTHIRMLDMMLAVRTILLVSIFNQSFLHYQTITDFNQIMLVLLVPIIITYHIRWLPSKWRESDTKCESVSVIVEAAQIYKKGEIKNDTDEQPH